MDLRGLWHFRLWVGTSIRIFVFVCLFFQIGCLERFFRDTPNDPDAAKAQAALETEFRLIKPVSGARLVVREANRPLATAMVLEKYATERPYAEIRSHYDTELVGRGWIFYEEVGSGNPNGRTARYCKGEYRADLEFPGSPEEFGCDYAFSLSWGLDSRADKASGKFRKLGCL